jgi:DNA polymerase III beta subunit
MYCYYDLLQDAIIDQDGSIADFKMNVPDYMEYLNNTEMKLLKKVISNKVVKRVPITEYVKVENSRIMATDLESSISIGCQIEDGIYELCNGALKSTNYELDKFVKIDETTKEFLFETTSEYLYPRIDAIKNFVGNDELRPVMSGVFFQFSQNDIKFVATDAHKLVKYERRDIKSNVEAEFVMPKKPLNILKNILSTLDIDVKIDYNKTNAVFTFDNFVLICRLIDGKYPNYDAVIPKENPNKLTINRNLFLSSVKRVAIFSNKSTYQIKLRIAGTELNISAEDIDFSNKAEERLTCDYQGDDLYIGFNSKFLLEMLISLESDDILLEMSLPNRAGILTPLDALKEGEFITMLVMPVMIN